jgi:hypothetical protein
MKKAVAVFVATLLTGSYSYAAQAQTQSTAKASATAEAKAQGQVTTHQESVTLDSASRIDTEMASTLDLKKVKPGDPFKMKTTRPVKSQGKEIISRGSTITGHVEQVTRADNTTKATLVFDQLEDKKTHMTSSLSAVVTAVAKAETNTSAMPGEKGLPTPAPRSSGQSSSQQSGGLLGGVTQTVGGVTQTVAGVAGQTGSTVDSTTGATLGTSSGVAGSLTRGAIQIVSDTTTTTTSGSTLALSGRHTKIESGTQFVLKTTSSLTLTRQPKQK